MKTLTATLALAAALALAACSGGDDDGASTGSISVDGYTATATICAIEDSGQFKTDITIERVEFDGSTSVMAQPYIISVPGQPVVMTFESTCTPEDLRVEVAIPEAGSEDAEATITIGIFDGEIVAAEPVLVLAVPE